MSTTTHERDFDARDLETRLRRDLFELAGVPAVRERSRAMARRRRPLPAMAAALVVVLVVVAAAVAVAARNERQPTSVGTAPRSQTILEQPAAITGVTTSIAKTNFPEVCERWQELPTGINCHNLQARFVWEPPANATYKFFVIEVVGSPDPKLVNAARNTAFPNRTTVTVRGRHVRVFGTQASLIATWQQRPDLQVWIQIDSVRGGTADLQREIVRFADAMHLVALDPDDFAYVVGSGTLPVENPPARGAPTSQWQFAWRPRDHRICATAIDVGESGCLPNVKPLSDATHRLDLTTANFCQDAWIATRALVFGVAPAGSRRVVITVTDGGANTTPLVVATVEPPGQPGLRVFVAPFDAAHAVTVTARDRSGTALASAQIAESTTGCTPRS